ncbi:NANOG neighbor homeobox [Plecturocebus cupreus]
MSPMPCTLRVPAQHVAGRARRLTPVIPALWEAEVGRSQGQEIETILANMHFGRPRQADHLRSGVQDQPGQHETGFCFVTHAMLEYGGAVIAHCSLDLLGSRDSASLVAGTTDVCHHA